MSRITVCLGITAITAGLLACYVSPENSAISTSRTVPPGVSAPGSTTVAGSDLSCELAAFLAERCQSCHGPKPVTGAKLSLLGRADLVAPSPEDPKRTVVELALERMKDANAPMPPAPEAKANSNEIALVESWIRGGMPAQSCGATDTPPPPPPANDPFAAPPVCSSQNFWTQGDNGSEEMHPGQACISCHQKNLKTLFKASFDIAGTVFPTAHEPDDCYGLSGVTVVITDANNVEYKLEANAAGNFSHATTFGIGGKIAMPYRAKVVRNGVEHVMKDAQTNGDCNSCHTADGTNPAPNGKKAAGRIIAP